MKTAVRFAGAILMIATGLAFAEADGDSLTDYGNVALNRLALNQQLGASLDALPQDGPMDTGAGQKSVGRAVLFSAILPGAGQAYAGSWWKAATFLAVEATAVAINISYNNKGEEKDREFKAFADRHWSEQRYWSHVYYRLNDRLEELGIPMFNTQSTTVNGQQIEVIVDWLAAEEILKQYDTGTNLPGYTHELPETKTQQYYEMIGKYPEQFGNAWEDANFYDGRYNGYQNNITPLNETYVEMRDDSNRFYDIAGYGAMTMLVNHLFAAIDAGFTTRNANRQALAATYENRRINGEYINMFGMAVNW